MEQSELTALARRYLDLWEQQIAAGETNAAGGAAAEAARIMAQVMSGEWQPGQGGRKGDGNDVSPNNAAYGSPLGSAAAEPASVDGNGGDDEFARRLAQCAERLAALAAGAGGGGGGTDGGAKAK
jgi:hypothetical protein